MLHGQLRNLRILLVDDSEDVLEMMCALLTMEDAIVTTASGAGPALKAAAEADFDLLISDVGMPDMDGYQLVEALRAQSRNAAIPAIALTGYGGLRVAERALEAGFTDHLCKPVSIDVLLSKILSMTKMG